MLLMPVCGNEDIWSRAEVFWWPCRTTFGWTTSWGKDCKAALASTSNCRKVAERATDEVLMHKILIPMDNLSISTGFPWISGFWFSNDRALPSTSPTAPGMFASQRACAVFVHGSDFGEDFLGGFSQAGTTIQLGVGRIARFGFGIPGKRRGDFPTLILMDDVLPRCFLSIFRWEFGFLIWTEKGGKKNPKKQRLHGFWGRISQHTALVGWAFERTIWSNGSTLSFGWHGAYVAPEVGETGAGWTGDVIEFLWLPFFEFTGDTSEFNT